MPSLVWILKENKLQGLSGVTLTCLGIKQSFGLAIFQRMEISANAFVLLVVILRFWNSGFWNLYRWIESSNKVVAVYALDAEFSRPLYVFLCISSYEFLQSGGQKESIVCSYKQNGRSCLGILDVVNSPLSAPDIPFTDINNISSGIRRSISSSSIIFS